MSDIATNESIQYLTRLHSNIEIGRVCKHMDR